MSKITVKWLNWLIYNFWPQAVQTHRRPN